jgi:hypothetical protein
MGPTAGPAPSVQAGRMEPPSPKRQRQGGAAASPSHDGGSGAGPGPSSPVPTAAAQQGAAPAGLLDVLALLLCHEALRRLDRVWTLRPRLRLTCRGARLAVDAAVRSLDLREAATKGPMPDTRLPGLRAFVARLRGLQELCADADAPSLTRVVGQVVAAGGVADGVRTVRLSVAAPGSISPGLSTMLRGAFPGLQVRWPAPGGCCWGQRCGCTLARGSATAAGGGPR